MDVAGLIESPGLITAPAGCGKTHLLSELVSCNDSDKPLLVLTHTNAGVAALANHLNERGVESSRYRLFTIDGWILHIASLFPGGTGFDPSKPISNDVYVGVRKGLALGLKSKFIDPSLLATYSGVVVDEYQDCTYLQHAVIVFLQMIMPAWIFGDPLQGIFSFSRPDKQVEWEEVCERFAQAGELETPWRWKNAGKGDFGEWLLDARKSLQDGSGIDLRNTPPEVVWESAPDNESARKAAIAHCRFPGLGAGERGIVIGSSMDASSRHAIARSCAGLTVVEPVALGCLFKFCGGFDPSSEDALKSFLSFAAMCMTGVEGSKLEARLKTLRRGKARKPPDATEESLLKFEETSDTRWLAGALVALKDRSGTRLYRPTLYGAGLEAMELFSVSEEPMRVVAQRVRERLRYRPRKAGKRSIGSTLLLKGLESTQAVILGADLLDTSNLYVALTRASTRVVVFSPKPVIGNQ